MTFLLYWQQDRNTTRGWPCLTACIRSLSHCSQCLCVAFILTQFFAFHRSEAGRVFLPERVLPDPLSLWLGGVRLNRNCCAFSIRWNYRCVRGGVLLFRASCQSWGHFLRVWAPLLCFVWTWWGIFDSASRETNKDVVGHSFYLFIFFFHPSTPLPRSRNDRFLSQRDIPMIWRSRNARSSAR